MGVLLPGSINKAPRNLEVRYLYTIYTHSMSPNVLNSNFVRKLSVDFIKELVPSHGLEPIDYKSVAKV